MQGKVRPLYFWVSWAFAALITGWQHFTDATLRLQHKLRRTIYRIRRMYGRGIIARFKRSTSSVFTWSIPCTPGAKDDLFDVVIGTYADSLFKALLDGSQIDRSAHPFDK